MYSVQDMFPAGIRRGDVYFVQAYGSTSSGSEQRAGRPAVVVSNNDNNQASTVIEVVYCTTKPKTPLPTHVRIYSIKYPSTVLCEQVDTVSISKLGNYMGRCTPNEMKEINRALLVSLGLSSKYLAEEE